MDTLYNILAFKLSKKIETNRRRTILQSYNMNDTKGQRRRRWTSITHKSDVLSLVLEIEIV